MSKTNITVGQLINELKEYPENMPVLIDGYFFSRFKEKGDMFVIELIRWDEYENLPLE